MASATIANSQPIILKKVFASNYPKAYISSPQPTIRIDSVLPFRVRFTNIKVPGYGPLNPAPIGIAVIGYNNYIL